MNERRTRFWVCWVPIGISILIVVFTGLNFWNAYRTSKPQEPKLVLRIKTSPVAFSCDQGHSWSQSAYEKIASELDDLTIASMSYPFLKKHGLLADHADREGLRTMFNELKQSMQGFLMKFPCTVYLSNNGGADTTIVSSKIILSGPLWDGDIVLEADGHRKTISIPPPWDENIVFEYVADLNVHIAQGETKIIRKDIIFNFKPENDKVQNHLWDEFFGVAVLLFEASNRVPIKSDEDYHRIKGILSKLDTATAKRMQRQEPRLFLLRIECFDQHLNSLTAQAELGQRTQSGERGTSQKGAYGTN